MFRQRSGSSLCYACGRLNRVDATECFYCGVRRPGLWGFAPGVLKLAGRLDVARLVTAVCVLAYVASLALDPSAAFRPRGPLGFLAPGGRALDALGMTGAYAFRAGRWWTVLTAIYLHGGLLHLLFNAMWINQLAPAVGELYGQSRLFLIFTAGGVAGFLLSNLLGVGFSVGASGAIFGLLGAMVAYGRSRGGGFGAAVLRQYGRWAIVLFVFGLLMPQVNNLGHAGGFAGGYLAALVLGHGDRTTERPAHRIGAMLAVALTVLAFALAVSSAVGAPW